MMPFEFDAGTPQREANPYSIDRAEALLDAARDSLPEHATQADIYGVAMRMLRAKLCGYARGDTIRRSLWAHASVMAGMAEHAPEDHDELLLEIIGLLDTRP